MRGIWLGIHTRRTWPSKRFGSRARSAHVLAPARADRRGNRTMGKHSKRSKKQKRSSSSAASLAPPAWPMVQYPMMFPMMAPHAPVPEAPHEETPCGSSGSSSDSDSSASRHKYNKSVKAKLTGSATLIMSLPKVRLGEIIEAMSDEFDSTVTATFSEQVLCNLVWLLSRQQPNAKISHFRCTTYKDRGLDCYNRSRFRWSAYDMKERNTARER